MHSPLISSVPTSEHHEVSVLDPSILRRHRSWHSRKHWSGRFSISVWLRFPEGLTEMVQLMLGFRDQERRKSYLVDRCLPNRQTLILLNGILDLDVAGEVSELTLYLRGLSENAAWMLDECQIEPNEPVLLEGKMSSSVGS
ncbi:hypothetical protein ACXYTJ_13010 [Gilvimarinus sp. F26214L]|uniref:hypothetical protein n=1 Tax=Gilvimarinus sp. DZF01 TaxID=3461371 RepID=UPI004045AE4B